MVQTLSMARGEEAHNWVAGEIAKLLEVIYGIGELMNWKKRDTREIAISFGELFDEYEKISDSLVGILNRARKRGFVHYKTGTSGLLFYGRDNDIVITLTTSGVNHIKRIVKNRNTNRKRKTQLIINRSTAPEKSAGNAIAEFLKSSSIPVEKTRITNKKTSRKRIETVQ